MNNDKAIITFSFDDARYDSYRAINIAAEYGIKSTLNVTTAYVNNSIKREPAKVSAMSVTQVQELYAKGTEIACHGNEHNNDLANIINGKEILCKWLNESNDTKFGFASPHSKLSIDDNTVTSLKRTGIEYVRIGPFIGKVSVFVKFIRKTAKLLKSNLLFKCIYCRTVQRTLRDNYIICSVPIMADNTYEQIVSLVEWCVKKKYWCVLMFHSVLSENEEGYNDNFSWDLEMYRKLCEYLSEKSGVVDFMTTKEAYYHKCR